MIATVLLASFLTAQTSQTRVPAFQPHLNVRIQPAFAPRKQRQIVCSMPMIHKTPADDPKMLIPPRETGAAVRRIEPLCQSR